MVHVSKGSDINQRKLLASLLPSYLFFSKADGVNDQSGEVGKGIGVLSPFLLSFWALSAFKDHVFFSVLGHELSLVPKASVGEAYSFLTLLEMRCHIMKCTVAFHLSHNLYHLYN